MKQPDKVKSRILADWLIKAEADMDLAEHLISEEMRFFSAIAFHCQQAAENTSRLSSFGMKSIFQKPMIWSNYSTWSQR